MSINHFVVHRIFNTHDSKIATELRQDELQANDLLEPSIPTPICVFCAFCGHKPIPTTSSWPSKDVLPDLELRRPEVHQEAVSHARGA